MNSDNNVSLKLIEFVAVRGSATAHFEVHARFAMISNSQSND
jgi:hypothetical protein